MVRGKMMLEELDKALKILNDSELPLDNDALNSIYLGAMARNAAAIADELAKLNENLEKVQQKND